MDHGSINLNTSRITQKQEEAYEKVQLRQSEPSQIEIMINEIMQESGVDLAKKLELMSNKDIKAKKEVGIKERKEKLQNRLKNHELMEKGFLGTLEQINQKEEDNNLNQEELKSLELQKKMVTDNLEKTKKQISETKKQIKIKSYKKGVVTSPFKIYSNGKFVPADAFFGKTTKNLFVESRRISGIAKKIKESKKLTAKEELIAKKMFTTEELTTEEELLFSRQYIHFTGSDKAPVFRELYTEDGDHIKLDKQEVQGLLDEKKSAFIFLTTEDRHNLTKEPNPIKPFNATKRHEIFFNPLYGKQNDKIEQLDSKNVKTHNIFMRALLDIRAFILYIIASIAKLFQRNKTTA